MTDAATYIDEQKKAQLAALAQGGAAAVAELEKAKASIAASQQGSIDAALADSRTRGAGAAAEAEVAKIVGGGAASRLAELGTRTDLTGYLGGIRQGIEGTYMDRLKATIPALEAELAAGGGRGGGGGGRGGRGGDDDDPGWRALLSEAYGPTDTLRKAGLAWDAEQMVAGTGAPRAVGVQSVADEFGVPQYAIEDMFPGTRYMRRGQEYLDRLVSQGGTVRQFRRGAKQEARSMKGNQAEMRRYLTKQARQVLPSGKKRKRRR